MAQLVSLLQPQTRCTRRRQHDGTTGPIDGGRQSSLGWGWTTVYVSTVLDSCRMQHVRRSSPAPAALQDCASALSTVLHHFPCGCNLLGSFLLFQYYILTTALPFCRNSPGSARRIIIAMLVRFGSTLWAWPHSVLRTAGNPRRRGDRSDHPNPIDAWIMVQLLSCVEYASTITLL